MSTLKSIRAKQAWESATRSVPTPALAPDIATWLLRAPTANDLAAARESMENRDKREALLAAIERGAQSEAIAAARDALGLSDEVRPDIARRIELLVRCSVAPECEEDDAVWLADLHPVLFYELTNACLELANQGAKVKKRPQTSTETSESGTPSSSAE